MLKFSGKTQNHFQSELLLCYWHRGTGKGGILISKIKEREGGREERKKINNDVLVSFFSSPLDEMVVWDQTLFLNLILHEVSMHAHNE